MKSAIKPSGGRLALQHLAAAALLTLAGGQAMAAAVTLCAERYDSGSTLPGAPAVAMWGYRVAPATDLSCTTPRTDSNPSPVIAVPPGDTTLAITLINRLNVPTSIVLAGQRLPTVTSGSAPVFATDVQDASGSTVCTPSATDMACRVRSFTGETAAGATQTYTFNSLRPGTYLYQSGTHPQVQVQMGLFGMAKQDSAAGALYAGVPFAVDVPVVLSEVDTAMHGLVDSTLGTVGNAAAWKAGNNTTLNYAPNYFLINGRVFDGSGATDLAVTAPSGARIALRLANAGLQSRSLMLNSGHWTLVAEDGYAYPAPREQYTALMPAGKTHDALITAANVPTSGTNASLALFDRRGGTHNADGGALGGQVARVALMAPTEPSIQPIANQVVNEGAAWTYQVVGTLITAYTPLAVTPVPANPMTISASGLISWAGEAFNATPTIPTTYAATVSGSGPAFGGGTATASQSFNVRVNHTPTLAPLTLGPVAVSHGTVTIPAVLAGATDPDGDTLTAVPSGAPSAGAVVFNADGSATWTGPQPATGTNSVTFGVTARDPFNLQSATRTVTLNVAANVAPVASGLGTVAAPYGPITFKAGTLLQRPLVTYQLALPSPFVLPFASLVTATDADGSIAPATFSATVAKVNATTGAVLGLPAGYAEGSASVSADGASITVRPRSTLGGTTFVLLGNTVTNQNSTLNSNGVYRITYMVRDDQGLSSNSAVVYVRVLQ